MAQRELQSDHPSHGQPQQVTSRDPQRVEQAGEVVCHVRYLVGVAGFRAAAGVAVVDQDHLELRGKGRHLGQRPQRRVVPDPHHQDQRGSVAMDLVVQLLPVRLHHA